MRIPKRLLKKTPKRRPQEVRWNVIETDYQFRYGLIVIRKAKNGDHIGGYAEFGYHEDPDLFWNLVNCSAQDAIETTYRLKRNRKKVTAL